MSCPATAPHRQTLFLFLFFSPPVLCTGCTLSFSCERPISSAQDFLLEQASSEGELGVVPVHSSSTAPIPVECSSSNCAFGRFTFSLHPKHAQLDHSIFQERHCCFISRFSLPASFLIQEKLKFNEQLELTQPKQLKE